MRKIAIISMLLLCAVRMSGSSFPERSDNAPQISFNEAEYDFGTIPESSKKASYDYVFTNTGSAPLVITRAITSCRCISTSYTKKPIPPGGQGMITVSYDPRKQQGVFHKAVQIYSNAPEGMHIIIAKGEVVP